MNTSCPTRNEWNIVIFLLLSGLTLYISYSVKQIFTEYHYLVIPTGF